jgi:hypothetical protein
MRNTFLRSDFGIRGGKDLSNGGLLEECNQTCRVVTVLLPVGGQRLERRGPLFHPIVNMSDAEKKTR